MFTEQDARKLAADVAARHRNLSAAELHRHYLRVAGGSDGDQETWAVFRAAYFDALWAGALEMAPGPVIAGSEGRRDWQLCAAGHLTLSFTATDRLELLETNIELL
jgi:hypothetical protein